MRKKSQGLSINAIILVAIGLIVLVVLIAIFTGRMGNFVRGIDTTATCKSSCEAFGRGAYTGTDAKIQTECEETDKAKVVSGTYEDVPKGKVCCCKALVETERIPER